MALYSEMDQLAKRGNRLLAILIWASSTYSQTTAFTYQGRLTDGGTPANGPYDFEIKLLDS